MMNELLGIPEFRVALVTVVMLVLVQVAVRSKDWLEKNKTALRVAIWLALLLGAMVTDWLPDNALVWSEIWAVWLASIATTTIGHQVLVKALESTIPATRRT